jgi:glycosyltransferase involved in cell wall biosynthesis
MPHINIIARTNGVGLDQDVDLVHAALTAAGIEVTVSHARSIPIWRGLFPQKKKFDANIFLERVFPRWFGTASKNFLIPNQERFPERQLRHLKQINTVLCKSRHAEEIFSQYADTRFIGFTSEDRSSSEIKMDYQSYFHLAGRSTLKGTRTLLAVWKRHPEWPTLTVIQAADNAPPASEIPSNVNLITDYVTNEQLIEHLNKNGVHLCPSLSEGWGHYIVEAMACKAVVVTTDAPPMNELVSSQRGILIPTFQSEARHLGTNFYVDADALDTQLTALMNADSKSKALLGEHARAWFEANDQQFRTTFPATLSALIKA